MNQRIIKIDQEKCNGCGLCVNACHESALAIVNGKAVLLREDYCDGIGDCLPVCPVDAISFEQKKPSKETAENFGCECKVQSIQNKSFEDSDNFSFIHSRLTQWPIQIKLAPIKAEFYQNAELLIAADCTAYAYGNFHNEFINRHVTLIGCPKLDQTDYSEKLSEILKNNEIKSIKVVRMSVPCCGGIELAVTNAIKKSNKDIPFAISIISTDGNLL